MGAMRVVIGVLSIAALCAPAATAQDVKSAKAVADKR
jgi:hypothetical protein